MRQALLNDKSIKKIDPIILAQIENGVSFNQYLSEGQSIMNEANKMIDHLKQGNYNNYVGNSASSLAYQLYPNTESISNLGDNLNSQRTSDNQSNLDGMSIISKSVITSNIKAKRIMQIRKLEKEL